MSKFANSIWNTIQDHSYEQWPKKKKDAIKRENVDLNKLTKHN